MRGNLRILVLPDRFDNFVAIQIYLTPGNFKFTKTNEIENFRILKILNISLDRLKEKLDSKRFSAESCQSLACFHIRNSSSDSTLPISSRNTEQYSTGMHNFFDMKQLWINTIIASKSRTSFQLNRKKLDKFSPRCNANYNNIPDTQDLLFEQQALVSLMSGQRSRSKRNSRNVHR